MNTPDSIIIVNRFFEALEILRSEHIIRGLKTFAHRYGINDRNIWLQRREPARNIFQPAWLEYLVRDYALSAEWLLLGEGPVFDPERKRTFDEARAAEKKAKHRKKTATALLEEPEAVV